ncbi:small terminase subunit [Ligilactobacillus sp. LYQ139]|uniref:small terminase subunit n=1 Tax=Ligilactobacillus sp. LYQ139 TaxID=3378800 RepID=UPI003852675A
MVKQHSMYDDWTEPENLILIQGWKRNGLTNEEIAKNIGINAKTLWAWQRKERDLPRGQRPISNALKIGRQQANFVIENKLFERARQGNTTAMIFWLKNNWRDKYNDSQLSVEERRLAQQRTKKLIADTKISEAKAKALAEGGNAGITAIKFVDDLGDDESDAGDEQS